VFDRVRTCDNHCEFCFIYQLPKGMRRSLYLKDDDYRLSFLYGNFTTLTRFTESDLERVITERLSPLHVSIHATDPDVRNRMLKNVRGGMSLRWLRALLDHGIEVRGQVVVCPGVNDGDVLDDTLAGVLDQYPELTSVAVVPLGLSKFNNEPAMRLHTPAEADRVVDLDDLIPSNLDSGAINPAYDAALQPRQRDRAASQAQIAKVARVLTPDALLTDFKQLDKGAPILGPEDRCVESGNGRVLALPKARQPFPGQWEAYQSRLQAVAASFGIDAAELEGMRSPVLVRERLDAVDRAAFAREANAPPVLQMSTLENAVIDAEISLRSTPTSVARRSLDSPNAAIIRSSSPDPQPTSSTLKLRRSFSSISRSRVFFSARPSPKCRFMNAISRRNVSYSSGV
jgi:hypothetical protein